MAAVTFGMKLLIHVPDVQEVLTVQIYMQEFVLSALKEPQLILLGLSTADCADPVRNYILGGRDNN